jgi:alkaline phosphatase
MISKLCLLPLMLCMTVWGTAQSCDDLKLHSHNDYQHKSPFSEAYGAGVQSIEVDVYLRNDTLFVAHEEAEIDRDRRLENLYLIPLRTAISKASNRDKAPIQLLIDIKSDAYGTLARLIEILREYPDLTSDTRVSLVISGNRPEVAEYLKYPKYIEFDYQSLKAVADPRIWEKVALISLPFYKFTHWDGLKPISPKDKKIIASIVSEANKLGKPLRFWATPDSELAWQTFADLGICFINTDHPSECAFYFKLVH